MQVDLGSRQATEPAAATRRTAPPGTPTPREAVLRQRRAAARAQGLVALLERRPDLVGVHRPADLAAEGVRWSA